VTVTVGQAKEAARRWVAEEGSKVPGFLGAYHAGSVNWLDDESALSATSDVDVNVVLADGHPPGKRGKFVYRDVLLEVSYLARERLRSPELVLGDYHLAGGLRTPSVILDPSGELTALQAAVARGYAERERVRRRCEQARDKVLAYLDSLNASAPLHDQVIAWLFAAGITTHVLLVAGLKNPTVRRRYAAVRDLLAEYGRLAFHESLLELLGCARMSRARVEEHLDAVTEAFDAAKAVIDVDKTPFAFASDISDVARPIAIDGSRALIERGLHREAVFWLVATYSRCRAVLHHNAPEGVKERFDEGYRRLLGDLGVASFADLKGRGDEVRRFLPRVWEMAEAVMAANPEIED
jgi:hypothetical protein